MSFPTDPRDVIAELFVNGGWQDITSDVRLTGGINITRGRPNEAASVNPTMCQMTINNRAGKYSPRNPTGPYYGSIGRNTPVRLAVRTERDTFTRSVSSGWGSADTGGAWSTGGGSSTVPADFNVSAGVGTHSVPFTGAYRITYLGGSVYRDVDVSATVTMSVPNVLGGNLEPVNLLVSGLTTTDYFWTQITVSPAGAVSVGIFDNVSATVVAPAVVSGLTFTGQALRSRVQLEGQTLRAKVWDAALPEPYAWNAEGRSDRIAGRAAGWVGIRSGVAGSNTNTLPAVFSYDNVEVRSCRFAGEVSSWPQRWDLSGNDVYTPIEAAGPLRRLGQGATPLKSTYLRGNQTMSPAPLVYWPAEEGAIATSIASGIGGAPMRVDGSPQFAQNTDFVGSAPLPKVNGSVWTCGVAGAPNTGVIQTTFLMSVPSSGETDQSVITRIICSGTAFFWDLIYSTGGALQLKAYDAAQALIYTGASVAFAVNGKPVQVSVSLTQNGANIDWGIATLIPGAANGAGASGTLTGRTVGALTGIVVSANRQLTGTAIGHVMARNYFAHIFSLSDQLKAYAGETAKDRMVRLCQENNVPFTWLWDGAIASAAMGPQRRDTLLNLLGAAAAADMGSLSEQRSTTGLAYRTLSGHYNQAAALALDYASGHIAPPFAPVDDDQAIRNDVTVTRLNGSSSQATQTTGPLAVTDPSTGNGVGRYDTSLTMNVATDTQVPDMASWLLHVGTVDEARYPQVKVLLAKLARSRALELSALSVNVDDRLTVANPKTGMDPNQVSQLVRGYSEEISSFRHDLTFQCAPERPYETLVLDSATLGKLDSDTSTLSAAVGATNTTLLVADSTGTGWTTAPAEMPIPIRVGGETMNATAIGAVNPTYIAAGASAAGNNVSVTPALPAGVAAGDLLLVLAAIRNSGTGAPIAPAGYSLLAYGANVCLFGKIHSGTESAPTVTFAGGVAGATTHAQMAAFRGVGMTVLAADGLLNASAQNIAYPALAIPSPRATVLYLGWKQDAFTSVAPIAGAVEIGEVSTAAGSGAGLVWDYVIQTNAVTIPAGSFVVTGGVAAISRGLTVALAAVQSFTVTRSVNGVSKAQSAGASVRLARTAAIAL